MVLVGTHLFESLGVCCANEVGLHVVNASLRVHQILTFLPFDLDHPHHNTIYHIHRLAFVVLAIASFLIVFDSLTILVHVVLNTLPVLIFFINSVLNRSASLVKTAIQLLILIAVHLVLFFGPRLEIDIIQGIIRVQVHVLLSIQQVVVVVVESTSPSLLVLVILRVQVVCHSLVMLVILEVVNSSLVVVQVCLFRLLTESLATSTGFASFVIEEDWI